MVSEGGWRPYTADDVQVIIIKTFRVHTSVGSNILDGHYLYRVSKGGGIFW